MRKVIKYVMVTAIYLGISTFACASFANMTTAKFNTVKAAFPAVDAVKYQEILLQQLPEPVGGYKSLQKKINFPKFAETYNIDCKLLVWVYIEDNGTMSQIRIIEGEEQVSFCKSVIEALERTTWRPAIREGEPVGVGMYIPISFVH